MTKVVPESNEQPETMGYGAHLVFILCGLIIIIFGFWSNFSTIDIVSMTTGEVVPSSQVKSVQHLEAIHLLILIWREITRKWSAKH